MWKEPRKRDAAASLAEHSPREQAPPGDAAEEHPFGYAIVEHTVSDHRIGEDPLNLFPRALTKLNTLWKKTTYPYAAFGRGCSVHSSCDLLRSHARWISLGDGVFIAPHVWLNTVAETPSRHVRIVLGNGCRIGRRSTISARNQITLEPDVLLGPSVLLMDHNHAYADPERPIHLQGVTTGGRIVIEKNCWLGAGAVVVCGHGELVIGHNSVIGANAVVTQSCAPRSVLAGNPARTIRAYDRQSGQWLRSYAEQSR